MAKQPHDAKEEALRAARSLNLRPESVHDEAFAGSEFFDAKDLVQVKYEMLRRVQVEGDAVSASAEAFGFSRPSYYAAAAALEQGGLPALVPAKPGPRRAHKLTDDVVAYARAALAADPALRSGDLVPMLAERFGISVHRRSIDRALARAREPQTKEPKSGGANR
jgi:transposase